MSNTELVSFIQVVPVSVVVDVAVCTCLGPGVPVLGDADRFQFGLVLSSLDVDSAARRGGKFVPLVCVELATLLRDTSTLDRESEGREGDRERGRE